MSICLFLLQIGFAKERSDRNEDGPDRFVLRAKVLKTSARFVLGSSYVIDCDLDWAIKLLVFTRRLEKNATHKLGDNADRLS